MWAGRRPGGGQAGWSGAVGPWRPAKGTVGQLRGVYTCRKGGPRANGGACMRTLVGGPCAPKRSPHPPHLLAYRATRARHARHARHVRHPPPALTYSPTRHVPDQYTLVRTQAAVYFPDELYGRLEEALLSYGEAALGCRAISPIWMSYYVDGCLQVLTGEGGALGGCGRGVAGAWGLWGCECGGNGRWAGRLGLGAGWCAQRAGVGQLSFLGEALRCRILCAVL